MLFISLLVSVVIWGLVFWLLWWLLGQIGLPEPFNKVAIVILAIAAVVIILGLFMGTIAPFPFVASLVGR